MPDDCQILDGPRAHLRRVSLRASLDLFTADAVSAELVSVFVGGAALVAWGFHLGVSLPVMALLLALPIVAQTLQLPGALIARSWGHRRTVMLATLLSRAAILPLAFLSVVPASASRARVLLASLWILHQGWGALAAGARNDWLGEAVPAAIRGRYLASRERAIALLGALASLLVGFGLRASATDGGLRAVLTWLAAAASVVGIAGAVLQSLQRAPSPDGSGDAASAMTHLVRHRDARAGLLLAVGWHAACGLSAPFFGLYLIAELHLGFMAIASYAAAFAAARVLSARFWGWATDARGARIVLVACTAGLALSPLCWLACAPGRAWPLAIDAVIGGALFGGHAISTAALQLSSAPRRGRLFHLAIIGGAAGAAFACTALAGALVAASTPGASVRAHLAVSALLRAATVVAALHPRRDEQAGGRVEGAGASRELVTRRAA